MMTGSIDMPLFQQHKIGLNIDSTHVGSEIAHESVRAQRQKIASDVRSAYFKLVATQIAVDAGRDAVRMLEETQRVTTQFSIQQVVLRAEVLEVDARLARTRYDLSIAENGLATQREQFDRLLGRQLTTSFRVQTMAEQGADSPHARRGPAARRREPGRDPAGGSEGAAGGVRPPPGEG